MTNSPRQCPSNYSGTPFKHFTRACLAAALALGMVACSSSVTREGAPATTSRAKPGATVVVQRGDNLYRIATSNGIAVRDLGSWNGLNPPYTIYPGQRLRLSPGSGSNRGTVTRGSVRAVPPRSSASRPTPSASPTPAPVASSVGWRWPTEGALLSRFENGEPTKQGIDIAGTAGAPVRAAGNGVVVYSGSGLVGYGELIIIKHDDQWLSAYGHNRNRLVAEGETVKVGQQIAELGRSGASRDMLHFEIRYNGKPVDPLRYLPAK